MTVWRFWLEPGFGFASHYQHRLVNPCGCRARIVSAEVESDGQDGVGVDRDFSRFVLDRRVVPGGPSGHEHIALDFT